jgi:hypothetical protein
MSWLVSESYKYNMMLTVRIHFNAHIRTIVVLTGGKLTWIYFLEFIFYNDTPMIR